MNCIIVDDDKMSRDALTQLVAQVPYLNLIGTFSKTSDALVILNDDSVDVMFLDVEMPDITGMEFLKSLTKAPLTILATSKTEYAVDAFDCNVIDYLVKPIPLDRFLRAIFKTKELFDKQNDATYSWDNLFVKVDGLVVKIKTKDILWIEALGDYISINTQEKKYTVHATMKSIENKLPFKEFIRVHRSYLIALDGIHAIENNTVVIGKKLIPVGYVYKENLMKRLNLL